MRPTIQVVRNRRERFGQIMESSLTYQGYDFTTEFKTDGHYPDVYVNNTLITERNPIKDMPKIRHIENHIPKEPKK